MAKFLLSIIFLSVILSSCLRRDEFSDIPVIRYKEMYREDQSLWVKIGFTDGNGDIGLKDDQDYPPFGPCDDNYYNLIIDPYRMVNGKFVLSRKPIFSDCSNDSVTVIDSVGYDQRIKFIENEGRDKTLEGDIEVKLNEVLDEFPGDTIKFKLSLFDRALNKSNEIETDVIVIAL